MGESKGWLSDFVRDYRRRARALNSFIHSFTLPLELTAAASESLRICSFRYAVLTLSPVSTYHGDKSQGENKNRKFPLCVSGYE
jgi:hypothetical protein